MANRPQRGCVVALLVAVLAAGTALRAEERAVAADEDAGGVEGDPTRPIVFSLREDYSDLGNGAWVNQFTVRKDQMTPRHAGLGRRVILRFDLPFVTVHAGGEEHSGLGDLYAQALFARPFGRSFVLATGSGMFLPTASQDSLGTGKWSVAPVVLPFWSLPDRKGFFFVKLQDIVSFAGDEDRADVHALLTTPTLCWRFSRRSWVLVDTEAQTDWEHDARTSYRSGVQIGRAFKHKIGAWIKPEIPWGPHQLGDWTVKLTFYRIR